MKRCIASLVLGVFLVTTGTATAANFAPEPLKISAPNMVNLESFDYPTKIPVTVSGGPATVALAIFSSGLGTEVRNVRNGRLGWHSVDRIDTCIYISPQHHFPDGNSTIVWNNRDENDYPYVWRDYTYYLWACSDSTPARKAFRFPGFSSFDRSTVQRHDAQGKPLANPVFFSAAQPLDSFGETWNIRTRWIIGGDPEDASLTETTRYRSLPDMGRMALDQQDSRLFFTQTVENSAVTTRKWQWTANGDAVLQTGWSDNGVSVFPSGIVSVSELHGGPALFRDYLISVAVTGPADARRVELLFLDQMDGSPIANRDLGAYRITEAPGLALNETSILVSLPEAALFQTIDPYAELDDPPRSYRWVNGPGDGFGDTLPTPGGARGVALDAHDFTLFAEGGPDASPGVLTPDGTGAGHFPVPGLNGEPIRGMQVIDTESPYDGLYYGVGDSADVRYAGYDVFKGKLFFAAELWWPFIHLLGPYPGQTLHTGAEYTVIWCGYGYSAVRLEFSGDGGTTWNLVEDAVPAGKEYVERYVWRVPEIRSSDCRLRVLTETASGLVSTTRSFTISGPSGVADASAPRPFITVANSPNPFNPSTTIHYNLGLPGRATLTVYNALGQQVKRADLGLKSRGEYAYIFNGSGLTSGVYFYRIATEKVSATGKILLMK